MRIRSLLQISSTMGTRLVLRCFIFAPAAATASGLVICVSVSPAQELTALARALPTSATHNQYRRCLSSAPAIPRPKHCRKSNRFPSRDRECHRPSDSRAAPSQHRPMPHLQPPVDQDCQNLHGTAIDSRRNLRAVLSPTLRQSLSATNRLFPAAMRPTPKAQFPERRDTTPANSRRFCV